MEQIIFHIDVNSAFLSWSAIRHLQMGETTDLRTIPSIVGGDISKRHGVVLAKSISAGRYGIRTGEPVTDAFKKCPNLVSVAPDRTFYNECSQNLRQLLTDFSPSIIPYSIDECFITYFASDSSHDFIKDAHIIRETIQNQLGFTVNIGISSNYLLAKMASDFEKPNRVHTLFPNEIASKMWPLPVNDLFMVGHASASRLHLLGIHTIGQLAKTDPAIIRTHLKSHGQTIWEYANGIERTPICAHKKQTAKGIGHATTLSSDVTSKKQALPILRSISDTVAARLRDQQKEAGTLTLELKYASFESNSHQMKLTPPAQTSNALYQTACQLFDELWNGNPVRLIGLRTTELSDASNRQLSLFDYISDEKQNKLDHALDDIRKKFGDQSVIRGSSLKKNSQSNPYDHDH